MKKKSYGGLVVILFISILAFGCGALCGMYNVGEEFSQELVPFSVSAPVNTVSVINEKDFTPTNISINLTIPKTVVYTTPSKNYTNYTNYTKNTTNSSTGGSNNSYDIASRLNEIRY